MDMFLRRCERLLPADERNLSLADVSRRFGLAAEDVQQLKAAGATNLSSLAGALLAALEVERLASTQAFARARRAQDPMTSRALPPARAHEVIRAIGVALDASLQKGERARPGARHAHPRDSRRRRKDASRR